MRTNLTLGWSERFCNFHSWRLQRFRFPLILGISTKVYALWALRLILWQRLGLPLDTCPEQAVITPACGLAGAAPDQARAALTRCREAGSMLAELIEETGEEPR